MVLGKETVTETHFDSQQLSKTFDILSILGWFVLSSQLLMATMTKLLILLLPLAVFGMPTVEQNDLELVSRKYRYLIN